MRLPTNTAAVTESSFPRRNSISGLITSRSSSSLRLKYRSLNHNLNLRRRISFQVKCLFGSSEAKQKLKDREIQEQQGLHHNLLLSIFFNDII